VHSGLILKTSKFARLEHRSIRLIHNTESVHSDPLDVWLLVLRKSFSYLKRLFCTLCLYPFLLTQPFFLPYCYWVLLNKASHTLRPLLIYCAFPISVLIIQPELSVSNYNTYLEAKHEKLDNKIADEMSL
jgi:hypothetical protein